MRRLLVFTSAFFAAVLVAQYFLYPGLSLYLGAVFAVPGVLLLLFRRRRITLIKLILVGLSFGFFWNFTYDLIFISEARVINGSEQLFEVRVLDYPQRGDFGERIDVKLSAEGPDINAKLNVNDSCYGEERIIPDYKPGDLLTVTATAELFSEKYEKDIYSPKGYTLYLNAIEAPEMSGTDSFSFRYFPVLLSKSIKTVIDDIFIAETASLMKAILTGDKRDLYADPVFTARFSMTGVSHVLAVSGMHLTFLAGLIRSLLGKGRRSALITVPVLLIFMAMVGGTPSVVRAGIMQIILLSASLFDREYDSYTALAFALLVIVVQNPQVVKDAGFQLSFASVLGIQLFSQPLRVWLLAAIRSTKLKENRITNSIILFIASSFSVSIGAISLITPLTALIFGQASIIAPLTNLLILWAVSLVFTIGFAAVLSGFAIYLLPILFEPLTLILTSIVRYLVSYISLVVRIISQIPFAAVYTKNYYLNAWLLFAYLLLVTIFCKPVLRRRFLWFTIPAMITLVTAIGITVIEEKSWDFALNVLDVGQGQSIVLSSEGETAIVDCGGGTSRNAGVIAAEYLSSLGKRRIEYLILTHLHADHANGVAPLLELIEIGCVILPKEYEETELSEAIICSIERKGVEVIYIEQREISELELGGLRIQIFPPLGDKSENEQGLSILSTIDGIELLITGDMDSETEYKLLELTQIRDIDLYVAGHHGSKNSNSERLLEAIRPHVVFISAGRDNSYGHPAAEALGRFTDLGAQIFRTDFNGDIRLVYKNKER